MKHIFKIISSFLLLACILLVFDLKAERTKNKYIAIPVQTRDAIPCEFEIYKTQEISHEFLIRIDGCSYD